VFDLAESRSKSYPDCINTGQCVTNVRSVSGGRVLEFSAQDPTDYKEREAIAKWTSFNFPQRRGSA
jgi:hypothetical protein